MKFRSNKYREFKLGCWTSKRVRKVTIHIQWSIMRERERELNIFKVCKLRYFKYSSNSSVICFMCCSLLCRISSIMDICIKCMTAIGACSTVSTLITSNKQGQLIPRLFCRTKQYCMSWYNNILSGVDDCFPRANV